MQLKEILDENSLKSISQRTNISESNIEALDSEDFSQLKRVKTLGFISILEREYSVDLTELKEKAIGYYDEENLEESVTLGIPMPVEKRGRSKFFYLIVIILIGLASWYFLTKFDTERIKGLNPFKEKVSTVELDGSHVNVNPEKLKIEEITMKQEKVSDVSDSTEEANVQNDETPSVSQTFHNEATIDQDRSDNASSAYSAQ